jgi:membrane-associated phospholipid phosphatase
MSAPARGSSAAFAFAFAVGEAAPGLRVPLHLAAATVAYSRVHNGVHYPSDVAAGAAVGDLCARAVRRLAGQPAARPGTRR